MYTPVVSRSIWSLVFLSNSGRSGIGGGGALISDVPMSNREIWPATTLLSWRDAPSMARSNTCSFWLRRPGRRSKAPARIRLSTPFLLMARAALRSMKS